MNRVLDACAMIAFLRDEPGADFVEAILIHPVDRCFAHTVNVCEVYYDFVRNSNVRTARMAIEDLARAGIRARRDMGRGFWQRVGGLKGTIRKISLANCFALALSEKLVRDVVTSLRYIMRPPNPIHPGQMLLEEFLAPAAISQRVFAQRLGWTVAKLNELVNGKRGVTAESALDLAAALKTSPEVWLSLQMHFDLKRAEERRKRAS